MKYDFTTILNRSQDGSEKWIDMYQRKPDMATDIVPFATADMEFKNPPEIVEGLKTLLDHVVLGYTSPTTEYYEAIINWMNRRHNYKIQKDWILTSAGIIPALYRMVKAYTNPGEGVLVMTPVYHPFLHAISKNKRIVVENRLLHNNETYEIDYIDLEEKASQPNNKILLFCSPHNPVGRVWTKDELEKVMDICLRNDVFVISDEIHHDLIMPDYTHTVMATLSPEASLNCAVCTAPSKSFNIAGLQVSNIIIENKTKFDQLYLQQQENSDGSLNIMAYEACTIAYNQCERWLDELLTVIADNKTYLENFFAQNIPEAKIVPMEGTYLLWIDFRNFSVDHLELQAFMRDQAQLILIGGYIFGDCGKGYLRMNIACPKAILVTAMERLLKAISLNPLSCSTSHNA